MLTTAFSELFYPPQSYTALLHYDGENDRKISCFITTCSPTLPYRMFRAASVLLQIGLNSKFLIFIGAAGFWLKRKASYSAIMGGGLGLLSNCVYRASGTLFDRRRLNSALEVPASQLLKKEGILQEVNLLYHLFDEYAKTAAGGKWLELASQLHSGNKHVLEALVNDYLLGNCTGFTCALLLSAKTWGRSPGPLLLQNIKSIEVVWFQFQATLASPVCLLSEKNLSLETRRSFLQQHEGELSKIRQAAKDTLLNLDMKVNLFQRYLIFEKEDRDLRVALSKDLFIQQMASWVAGFEKENNSALICARLVLTYGEFAHSLFVQFNGKFYRFCCNQEGLFSFSSRSGLLDGLFRYLKNVNSSIKRIDVYFYAIT